MYHGFRLEVDTLENIPATHAYTDQLKINCQRIRKNFEEFYCESGNLDGNKIRQAWFPELDRYHVFISHSHSDITYAERVANWLYDRFGITSFIDSYVWGFANDLLREIDNRHALRSSGNYDYDTRNHTTSHVHMMLNNALASVIDSSECLIFINTDNAVETATVSGNLEEDRTKSPWIMSELQISKLIAKKEDPDAGRRHQLSNENFGERHVATLDKSLHDSIGFEHKVDVEHLSEIDINSLLTWEARSCGDKGYRALTHLYSGFGDPSMENLVNPPLREPSW
ncbi:Uncharacterised protein [BD1-7 clade bacterium]|uniref:TIR domain-containing protein n=1 Tax=BD1-7 clade bacterium TaxID=2029982 RepID=A0A5S9NQL0_9GAMM|nr:Uncharacterised protein [BD1-7 clade bacterium]